MLQRRSFRTLAGLLAALTGAVVLQPQTALSGGQRPTIAEQYLFQTVNQERAAAGLSPLRWEPSLAMAATAHAAQMRAVRQLSHQLSGEPGLSERAATAGAHFSRVTENVAVGRSVLEMHDALMHSPHHRENILDPRVNTLAVAVVPANGELWAVEDFAHNVETLSFSEQETQVAAILQPRLPVSITEDARQTCRLSTGFVGERPGFVMRYTTSDLQRLPDVLETRISTGRYSHAAVGTCAPEEPGPFTSYNITVLLYR